MSRAKALIAWSSGKDSAFALHVARHSLDCEIVGALTTVTDTFRRVSIHGVRQEVLRAQSVAAGLPLRIVPIPYPCPNEVYEQAMASAMASARADGVMQIIFGDLFLSDIRAYREQKLAGTGIATLRARRLGTLSGGQLQRVWIAMVLAQETGIVCLDDVMAALAELMQRASRALTGERAFD